MFYAGSCLRCRAQRDECLSFEVKQVLFGNLRACVDVAAGDDHCDLGTRCNVVRCQVTFRLCFAQPFDHFHTSVFACGADGAADGRDISIGECECCITGVVLQAVAIHQVLVDAFTEQAEFCAFER